MMFKTFKVRLSTSVLAAVLLASLSGAAGAVVSADAAASADAAPAKISWTGYVTGGLKAGWNRVTKFLGDDGPKVENPAMDAVASDDSLPEYLAAEWGKLTDSLTDALALRDRREKLPESAWFGEDRSSNAKKINTLLDAALEILVQGRAGDIRREASDLRTTISDLRHEADKLRNERLTAPDGSKIPWKTTRAKIDERLKDIDAEIREREDQLESINASLAEALRDLGLDLDRQQIDVLLSSVTGDDMLRNTVVFANVKVVVEKLAALAGNDQNDLEINRRYTGMYLVLNDLLIHTQEELVRRIDTEYKPRLDGIVAEAEKLRNEAQKKSLQKTYSDDQRAAFTRNAESNALTIRVGQLYEKLLASQRRDILENLKDLKRSRDVAENTYRTVRSSGDLKNLIHSGLSLFDSINALSMPQLQPFENDAMRLEFEEINRRMKQ